MDIALKLKNNLKNIHPKIGRFINRVPFSVRPGIYKTYNARRKDIKDVEKQNGNDNQQFVFDRIKNLVDFSYTNILFYKTFYDSQKFHPDMLNSFVDIEKIPIINKKILNSFDIDERSSLKPNAYKVNTGGSTGEPFSFYIESSSMGHEWAHMHKIWSTIGYKVSDFKITFGGRSNVNGIIDYDVVRNSFNIDIYADFDQICSKLISILRKYKIKYLHGYPSSIYKFAVNCKNQDGEVLQLLRKHLVGAFLGSEYPHKKYRDVIESVFQIKTISWYGHTERAVLAYEQKESFVYSPFLSYGFSEAILNKNGDFSLVSTSYYNFASPLIRYDTEDLIEQPEINFGILNSFKITKGRSGEFVVDKNDNEINLTALIFGRHHKLFDFCSFIQVKQSFKGHLIIYYVSDIINDSKSAELLFDTSNSLLSYEFLKIEQPITTISGKINLLVK